MEWACTLHILWSTTQYIHVHTCAYMYVLVYIMYILVLAGVYKKVLVCTNILLKGNNLLLRFAMPLNVSWTWLQGMDTGDQSHLANYDFDQPEQHVPLHTGPQARLEVQHHWGDDRWAPSAGPYSVAGNLLWHGSAGYTWTLNTLWCYLFYKLVGDDISRTGCALVCTVCTQCAHGKSGTLFRLFWKVCTLFFEGPKKLADLRLQQRSMMTPDGQGSSILTLMLYTFTWQVTTRQ